MRIQHGSTKLSNLNTCLLLTGYAKEFPLKVLQLSFPPLRYAVAIWPVTGQGFQNTKRPARGQLMKNFICLLPVAGAPYEMLSTKPC